MKINNLTIEDVREVKSSFALNFHPMEFKVEKKLIENNVSSIGKLVSGGKTALDIYNDILLEVNDGRLNMYAASSDIEMSISIPVMEAEDGKALVDRKKFTSLIKAFDKDAILSISTTDSNLTIQSEGVKYRITTQDPDLFPHIKPREVESTFMVTLNDVIDALEKVEFCAATDDTRLFLTGILWDSRDYESRFVATDSFILGLSKKEIITGSNFQAILPRNLRGVLKDIDAEKVEIGFTSDQDYMLIRFPEGFINVRLIQGPYPDYESIFPQGTSSILSIEREELDRALKAATAISPSNIKFILSEGEKRLYAANTDGDVVDMELEGAYTGETYEIVLDTKRFNDIIRHIPKGIVEIHIYGDTLPILIKSGEENIRYLIMPVKI